MTKLLAASILAGIIAAIAFASATTGPAFTRFLLFLVTPLPIFMVGLGIGWRAAAISAAAGGITLALLGNIQIGALFTVSQMIPGVILSYLALLNRPITDDAGRPAVEWYPVGRLILWASGIGSGIAITTLALLGNSMDRLREELRGLIEKFMTAQLEAMGDGQSLKPEDLDRITDVALQMLPAIMAISVMGALLFNLWLAGRIARAAGQLTRPWPDLAAFTFPPLTQVAFAVALGVGFISGTIGLMGSAVAGSLFFAYILMGLAIIHYTSRGNAWRWVILWLVYFSLIFANGITLLIALLGVLERFSPIRRDFIKPRGGTPPPPPGPTGGPPP
ncbi:MAG: DUF2232 domain-containing protein [Pseudomonadota bacterium]